MQEKRRACLKNALKVPKNALKVPKSVLKVHQKCLKNATTVGVVKLDSAPLTDCVGGEALEELLGAVRRQTGHIRKVMPLVNLDVSHV